MAGGFEEANKENNRRQIVPSQQINQYKHGSIRKIVFKNFLTYDSLVCHPGPFLNVVIGPNGTGKSSIICGICLAVGGKPNILGRSDNIADFVKHGKQQGSVELHIWDAEFRRDIKYTMLMSANKNSATYLRNGQQIKVTELREEISQYNIQVDNPCTFLAQDKVKSFAEQGPKKLLRNTEKAGPEILSDTHDELIELEAEGGEYEEKVERLRKRLDAVRVDMASRKDRVDNYLEWSNRNKTLKSLKLKQFYIEYNHQLDLLREATARVDACQRKRDGTNGNLETKERSIRKMETILKELDKELTQMKASKKKELAKIRELAANNEQDDKLQKAADDFKKTQDACQNWDKDQDELKENHRKFKQLHETKKHSIIPDPDMPLLEQTLQREGERIRAEENAISERQKTLFRLDNQFHSQSNQQKNNLDSKLRSIVQIRNNDQIMHAWEYYVKNRDKFKGPVYVPFLHVQIPNSNNLIYFNNNISPRSMSCFIFSCQEDEQLLLRQFKVDTSIITQQFIQEHRIPKTPLPDVLKNLGFIDVLYNMFEAPDAVSVYLNGFHNMDKILIGGPAVDENYERICKKAREFNPTIRLFMTRKIIVNITGSRFNRGQEYVERNNMIASLQRFGPDHTQKFDDIDKGVKEVEEERQKLNKRHSKLQEDKANFRKLLLQYREKKDKKQKEQDELDKLAQQVKKYEERIRMRTLNQQEKPSVEEAKKAYTEAKRAIMMETINNLDKLATALEQQRESASKYALKSDEMKRLKWRIEGLRREKEGMKEVIDQYKREYQESLKARATVKEGVDFAKANFKEDAKFSPSEEEMTAEQKAEFAKIKEDWVKKKVPDDLDELKEMYRKTQAKALKRQEGTHKDVEDYENLQKELREITNSIEKTEAKNQIWKQKMDEKLERWLNVLRALVQEICRNFKEFFAHLHCEGLVQLDEPENKYKINEYGIKIFVKFRDGTALRELDSHTQSGGERSVATMLYIMALQNLCPVPFRCVDEINQGMDPANERAVFNMMVNLLNMGDNVSKTQYFLLTPKLLNGLEFNDRVCVHVVHNGPSIEHPERWDINRFLNA